MEIFSNGTKTTTICNQSLNQSWVVWSALYTSLDQTWWFDTLSCRAENNPSLARLGFHKGKCRICSLRWKIPDPLYNSSLIQLLLQHGHSCAFAAAYSAYSGVPSCSVAGACMPAVTLEQLINSKIGLCNIIKIRSFNPFP